MKAKALAIAVVVTAGASLLAASPNARAFQLFNRADVEATFHASSPASVLLWSLGRGDGAPFQPPPPLATFLSVSPRVIIGSTLTEDGAHYCAEDWLALFTPDIVFSDNQSPSPNQLRNDTPYALILDGQVLNTKPLPYQPFPLFDDGQFPNVWARLIGTIAAPAVDDGEPMGHYPILEIGEHELTLTSDGAEVQTITFVVDGPESDTCNSFCRGMNPPDDCL